MCHGAPETWPAPSTGPSAATSQYFDMARCPPQANRTAVPLDVNLTVNSAVAVAVDRTAVGRAGDRGDRPTVEGQAARDLAEGFCPRHRQAVRLEVVAREGLRVRRRQRGTEGRDPAALLAAQLGLERRIPGRQVVIRLVPAGREVVADVDAVGARVEAFDGQPERDHAALREGGVVAVQIAVLPGAVERCPLIKVEVQARGVGPLAGRHRP